MTLRECEQPIAQISLHAGLLAIEQVSNGYGHVKVFGLKETKKPRAGCSATGHTITTRPASGITRQRCLIITSNTRQPLERLSSHSNVVQSRRRFAHSVVDG